MGHPGIPGNYTETSAVVAHQLFQVALAAEAGPADPAGDITMAHQGPIEAVLPTNDVTIDSADALPGADPDWLVVVRPEPRMQNVSTMARMIDRHVYGDRPAPFVKQGPTRLQQGIEAWASRGGVRGFLGRLALAKGWGYDEKKAPIVATDLLAERTLRMNAEFGEIVPPGAQPVNNYRLTLLRNTAEGVVEEDEFKLTWGSVRPNVTPSDRELAARSTEGVSLDRIMCMGAVIMGGARVLRPEYALELRQRGLQVSIIGAEAAGPSTSAHLVLRDVLGLSPALVAREDAGQTLTYLVAAGESATESDSLNVQSITIVERAATVHPNMAQHQIGDLTSTERSIITDVVLDPVEETGEESLRVRIENLYDLRTGELTRWRVQYGTSSYRADTMTTGNARMRGVALPQEQRARVHAAIEAQLHPENVRDNFQPF